MSWLYESFRIPSDVHGEIRCTRLFGRWTVEAGGTGQASDYLNAMWRKALRRAVPEPETVTRILILGFGTGGAFPEFYRRFPKAHIVTIEIDPVMVDLARRFGALNGFPWPEIHVGRAEEILPTVTGQFDLVISDMFVGHDVAKDTASPILMRELSRLIRPNGHLLINAYREPTYFNGFSSEFAFVQKWKYLLNWIAHFRPHGAGVIGDALPAGYVPFFSCKEYLEREYRSWPPFEVVDAGDAHGVRQTIGPISIERYHGDVEPALAPGRLRVVLWDSWTRLAPPAGWHRFPGNPRRSLMGYAEIPATGDIHPHWSELARRERKKWLAQEECTIATIDAETYCAAYAKCGKSRSIIRGFSSGVRRKAKTHGDLLHLYAVISRATGEIVAGLATLDVPEIKTSIHVTGFILPSARHSPAGVGLVNQWFRDSQSRGIRFCDFDGFYAKGEPIEWKGFSRFKSQFGTKFIAYPKPFWRIAR